MNCVSAFRLTDSASSYPRAMPRGYERGQTAVHLMNYHFAWCPKYRRKILVGKIAERLDTLIHEKATQLGCEILNLSIAADHAQFFIQAYPLLSPNRIVAQIKGYSSMVLMQEFPELLRMQTRSYFVLTASINPHDRGALTGTPEQFHVSGSTRFNKSPTTTESESRK